MQFSPAAETEINGLCDDAAQAGASGVKAARVVAERINK